MAHLTRRHFGALALATSTTFLAACGGNGDRNATSTPTDSDQSSGTTKKVTDNRGTVTVPVQPQRIAATDNRLFRTLEAWGVELVAAPLPIIAKDSVYKNDDSIMDIGSHREPNLETFVAAKPDLLLNGQRFTQHFDDIKALLPDTPIVDTDIDIENKPLDKELIRQITLVGTTVGHEDEAAALISEFEKARDRVAAAYDPSQTVMGAIAGGGKLNYSAPITGRAVGPLYPLFNLTPALKVDGTGDHQGDDISVEAVASSNPDWIIIMDRDAALDTADESTYQPAAELVEKSEALSDVTAVKKSQIVYLPNNFYLTEDIQAYTQLFNEFADKLEKAK